MSIRLTCGGSQVQVLYRPPHPGGKLRGFSLQAAHRLQWVGSQVQVLYRPPKQKSHPTDGSFVLISGGRQTAAQRSGCGLERRSSGVSELSSPRGSELIRSLRRRYRPPNKKLFPCVRQAAHRLQWVGSQVQVLYRPPKQKSRLQAALRKEVGLRWLLLTKNIKQACPQWPRLFYLLDFRVHDPMLVISVDNGASPPHPSRLTPCRLPLKGKAFSALAVSRQTGIALLASVLQLLFKYIALRCHPHRLIHSNGILVESPGMQIQTNRSLFFCP